MAEQTLGKIGKYELVELIGEGAMGKVYRALDPVLGRNVAIKLMSASIANDAHLRDRFLREARAAANLQHPNVITIYDFGETDGHPFIAMEFIEGTDLAHLIEQHEPLSLDSKVQLVVGLLNGLAYAHTKGVVHRDIKPANIRVTTDGRVKIMDFGIAHLQGSEITHSGAVLGTPDYMAPEQVRGLPVTAATDIFAAGAVLYELLTYQKPFTGETLHAVLFKVVTENPRPIRDINTSLPEHLQRIVDTALNKDPGGRYPTADAMAADLFTARGALTDLETVATLRFTRPLNLGLPPLHWWKGKKAKYAAGASAAVVVLVGLGWAMGGGSAPPPAPTTPVANAESAARNPASQVAGRPDTQRAAARRQPTGTRTQQRTTAGAAGTTTGTSAGNTNAGTGRPKPPTTKPADATTGRPVAPPKLAATSAADRAEIERQVGRLERAISTARTSEIKQIMPGLTKSAAKNWDDFFKNRRDFRTSLRAANIQVTGDTGQASLNATFDYLDSNGERKKSSAEYIAVLVRNGGTWTWKELKSPAR